MAQPPPYPTAGAPYYPKEGPRNDGGVTSGFPSYGTDIEGGTNIGGSDELGAFSDKNIRYGFIRKVFGILSVQLIVTAALATPFSFSPMKEFARQNYWLAILVMVLSFILIIALSCCESARRKQPLNYVLLSAFTVCEGFMVGLVTSTYDVDAVLMAAVICAGLTIGLTLFAMQTKIDFVSFGGVAFVALLVLMFAGILLSFFPSKPAMIAYASIGSLLFAFYIVYDVQLMVGGKHKYAIDPEDYVFAALNLYLDIVNLFLFLLRLIGAIRSD